MAIERSPGSLLKSEAARLYVGMGRDRFRKSVNAGLIPVWIDPETKFRWFSRASLDRWLAEFEGGKVAPRTRKPKAEVKA